MTVRVCLAGATGHVGRELVAAIAASSDLELVACVGASSAGRRLRELVAQPCPDLPIDRTIDDARARQPFDVLIDYTTPTAVFATVTRAIDLAVHAVVGTSGLTDEQYGEIDDRARARGVGVVAAGNFSLTAALMAHFAGIAARFLPSWELLDYGTASKPDAPSGTTRELAHLLARVGRPEQPVPPERVQGRPESRGATLAGTQVHSLRLPGFYSSSEAIFGLPGERLSLRHDSISSAPYVAGTLLAARRVPGMIGLTRGMAAMLDLH